MKRAIVAAALAALAFGCASQKAAKTGDVKGTTAAGYYPLRIGSSWTYQLKFLGEQRTETVTIEKIEDGFYVDSKGARLMADAYGVRDDKRYLLREPVATGTTWTNVVSVEAVEHYKIVSAGASCAAPAGQFKDCAVVESKVRLPQGTLINELTFAQGVGLVRIATTLETNGKQVPQATFELTSWKLAPLAEPP